MHKYCIFDNIVIQIYSLELQLNKANTSDTKAALFIFVNLSDLLEHLVMLQTSTFAKNFKSQ